MVSMNPTCSPRPTQGTGIRSIKESLRYRDKCYNYCDKNSSWERNEYNSFNPNFIKINILLRPINVMRHLNNNHLNHFFYFLLYLRKVNMNQIVLS